MRTRECVSRGGIGGLFHELPTQLEGMNLALLPTRSSSGLCVNASFSGTSGYTSFGDAVVALRRAGVDRTMAHQRQISSCPALQPSN